MLTVSAKFCAAVSLSISDAGVRIHVGGSLAATAAIEHARFTIPENPLLATALAVVGLPVVASEATEMGVGWKRPGGPKLDADAVEPRELRRPTPFGLPQPVTRS